ncbi:MAG: type II secretion system F family protein [Candidatus Bathycorpusculaceae bacterium]
MSENKVLEKIRKFQIRLKEKLKRKNKALEKESKVEFGKPHSLAFQLIGGRIGRVLPLFKDLDQSLYRSGIKVNFKAYVSLTVFSTLLLTAATVVLVPPLMIFAFHLPFLPALLYGCGGGLFTFAFSIIGFYAYPSYRADKLRRELEDELPFTTGYMAILASAGVSPEKIFHSLSNMSAPLAISYEARNIIRDINLFGLDIISALEGASKRSPSEIFRENLEGFISTIHSGGNLAAYLREKSKQFMKLKRIGLKKFSDTLSILSEFYISLLLTGPLLLVIMLAVISMLGGGLFGFMSSELLLNLLTYIGIPVGAIIFLIILDAISPRW